MAESPLAHPLRRACALAAALSCGAAAAQERPIVLEPLVVTAPRWETDWLETPAAIGVIEVADVAVGRRYAALELQAVDRLYADNANATRVPGYGLINLRFGWRTPAGAGIWEPFVGVRNLFDKDYDANIRVNAGGQRYYEPAPGRHFYAGLRAAY